MAHLGLLEAEHQLHYCPLQLCRLEKGYHMNTRTLKSSHHMEQFYSKEQKVCRNLKKENNNLKVEASSNRSNSMDCTTQQYRPTQANYFFHLCDRKPFNTITTITVFSRQSIPNQAAVGRMWRANGENLNLFCDQTTGL